MTLPKTSTPPADKPPAKRAAKAASKRAPKATAKPLTTAAAKPLTTAAAEAVTNTDPKGPGRPSKADQLTDKVASTIAASAGVAQAVVMGVTGDSGPGSTAQDFAIIAGAAPQLATALVKVGDTNPALKKLLDSVGTSGAYGELLVVTVGMIVVPIMANHSVARAALPAAGPTPQLAPADGAQQARQTAAMAGATLGDDYEARLAAARAASIPPAARQRFTPDGPAAVVVEPAGDRIGAPGPAAMPDVPPGL